MMDFFIFSSVIFLVSIISYHRNRRKIKIVSNTTCYYFADEKVIPKDKKIRYYNTVILLILYISLLLNIVLLITFLGSRNKIFIFIALLYIIVNILYFVMYIYKFYEKKIKSFYYDIKYAAEMILNDDVIDERDYYTSYPKKSEINELLDEVIEEVKHSEDSLSDKDTEILDNEVSRNTSKRLHKVNKKYAGEEIITVIDPKKDDVLVSIIAGGEKEERRRKQNLAYKKEQEEVDMILAFLDSRGLD